MKHRVLPYLIVLAAACGYITGTTADVSLSVSFHGTSQTLLPAIVELQVQSQSRSYTWIGGTTATPAMPQEFAPVGLQGGDSLTATAILRNAQGVELVRTVTGVRLQSGWLYGLGFQAGGVNLDVQGFCHQPARKAAIPGFVGDTLFLWSSAIPQGAVC